MTSKQQFEVFNYHKVIQFLRQFLIHQPLPNDASENDILNMVQMFKNGVEYDITWMPTTVIFLGPGQGAGPQNMSRICVFYNIDRKITDVGIG